MSRVYQIWMSYLPPFTCMLEISGVMTSHSTLWMILKYSVSYIIPDKPRHLRSYHPFWISRQRSMQIITNQRVVNLPKSKLLEVNYLLQMYTLYFFEQVSSCCHSQLSKAERILEKCTRSLSSLYLIDDVPSFLVIWNLLKLAGRLSSCQCRQWWFQYYF